MVDTRCPAGAGFSKFWDGVDVHFANQRLDAVPAHNSHAAATLLLHSRAVVKYSGEGDVADSSKLREGCLHLWCAKAIARWQRAVWTIVVAQPLAAQAVHLVGGLPHDV